MDSSGLIVDTSVSLIIITAEDLSALLPNFCTNQTEHFENKYHHPPNPGRPPLPLCSSNVIIHHHQFLKSIWAKIEFNQNTVNSFGLAMFIDGCSNIPYNSNYDREQHIKHITA